MVITTVRVPEEVYEALKESAQNNRRSINSEILRAIEFYLKEAPEAHYQVEKPVKVKKPMKKTK